MTDLQSDGAAQLSGTAVAPAADLRQEPLDGRLGHVPLDFSILSNEEQALESHEVIELQTFSERKVWIEEKIKFLEQLPPVEVFAGLDAVRTSAEHVPGVPAPDELKRWIAEHDAIEKETEIFDRGELTKLRQLTKAAAQRNLSPADTDLIELALTTIYELDKLLHLLRDRSENLDLLATRISWEESRIAAWVDRRTILEDLQTFLDNRVRWTPSTYESVSLKGDETPDLKRRSSIASLASASSDTSSSSLGLSRGARFKLAESLSHDAAQFAGRVTSLRHGKISAAGRILDRLIDQSRKPVPDELLDEQDKLEEQGITEMENLGKFILSMVVQWRKADEIYVETMLDKTTGQNLLEEIETAKLHHPTARQSASFISRADALIRRLASRGNPASSTSTFPSPEHPLFIDQRNFNQILTQSLSSEIMTTFTIARKADDAAKAYRTAWEAVKRVEDLTSAAKELSNTLTGIFVQLQEGILAVGGDGSPPNLTSITCLELDQHSAFLALFPSILQQFVHTAEKSKQILQDSVPVMLGLEHPGIDGGFINTARSHLRELGLALKQVQITSEDMKMRCDTLTEARKLNTVLKETMNSLENIEHRISASIETQRWQRVTGSPSQVYSVVTQQLSPPPTGISHAEYLQELLQIDYHIDREVDRPLGLLVKTLEDPLKLYLMQRFLELRGLLDEVKKHGILLDSIQRQTAIMKVVYEEFSNIQRDIEVLGNRFAACTREVLNNQPVNGSIPQADADLQINLDVTQAEVSRYINRLSDRIPFVSQDTGSTPTRTNSDGPLLKSDHPAFLDSKFDLPALDSAVRADSNSFCITLSNNVEELNRHLARFHLTHIAKEIDIILVPTAAHIDRLIEDLVKTKSSWSEIISRSDDITLPLNTLFQDVEQTLQHGGLHAFSQICDLFKKMDVISEAKDISAREALYVSRIKSFDHITTLYNTWRRDAWAFLNEIKQKYTSEIERMECLRIAEEQYQQAEGDRAEVEKAGYLHAERERLKKNDVQGLCEQADHQRTAAQRAQLEQVCLEAEEDSFLEDERLMKEESLQSEQREAAKIGNINTQEESWRLQVERLNTDTRDEVEKVSMAQTAEIFQEEESEGAERENDECCVAGQSRRFNREVRIQTENDRKTAEEIEMVSAEEERTQKQLQHGRVSRAADEELPRLDTQAEKAQVASEVMIVNSNSLVWDTTQEAKRHYLPTEQLAANDGLQNDLEEDRIPMDQGFPDTIDHLPQMTQENIIDKPLGHASELHVAQGQSRDVGIHRKIPASHATKSGQRQTKGKQRYQSPELHRGPKKSRSNPVSTLVSAAYKSKTWSLVEEDVFGPHMTSEVSSTTKEMRDLQGQVLVFRKRLRSTNMNEIVRPTSSHLPDMNQWRKMVREFSSISSEVSLLPRSASEPSVDLELRSLRTEIEGSVELMKRVKQLAHLAEEVQKCDTALSDLLEHIDSYPASPKAVLSSSHITLLEATPEEQLTARLAFTCGAIEAMTTNFAGVSTDLRAISEKTRILQTWNELGDMVHDLMSGRRSRPASDISSRPSSGRNSRASRTQMHASIKTSTYSNLTTSVSSHQRLLLPRHPTTRRAVSGGVAESQSRPVSQLSSLSSSRAVSGPFRASVYNSTFASRQRTSSLSNPQSPASATHIHSRPQTVQHPRVASPTGSDTSPYSRLISFHTRSSTSISGSSWARAPRNSPSSIVKSVMPKDRSVIPRKTYVADPKNKLDVAVGDVVNKLPVGINVEGVAETWKDQSGKYWIGNQDPKLCFCRILRSQTVMVRVGGGWSELSKFIRDHFADSFRLLSESPPRFGSSEEKWISSSTLLEAPVEVVTPPVLPRTPEPTVPFVPSFSISTPDGKSPRSLHSASNSPSTKGSPLTPLQFIRRADVDNILRPGTPSKPSTTFSPGAITQTHTSTRNLIWRP
ncbi:hypothetical protein E4T56_gene1064 [Termitomyces sp. T112]|nr:hypothetical protein E4T56_gene1064 [Termitomyces sp. T112]